MKPYPEYKDSEFDWFGSIPKHWNTIKLCRMGSFSASGIDKKYNEDETSVRMVNYTNVYGNNKAAISIVNSNLMETTTTDGKIIEHQLKKGDLLFTPSSETEDEMVPAYRQFP